MPPHFLPLQSPKQVKQHFNTTWPLYYFLQAPENCPLFTFLILGSLPECWVPCLSKRPWSHQALLFLLATSNILREDISELKTKFKYKLFTAEIYVWNSAPFKGFLVNKKATRMHAPEDARESENTKILIGGSWLIYTWIKCSSWHMFMHAFEIICKEMTLESCRAFLSHGVARWNDFSPFF